jgi:hypothetical protein
VESTFKASSASWPTTEYHIGFGSSTNGAYLVWYGQEGTYAGNGAASNANSSNYYHWDSTATVSQGAGALLAGCAGAARVACWALNLPDGGICDQGALLIRLARFLIAHHLMGLHCTPPPQAPTRHGPAPRQPSPVPGTPTMAVPLATTSCEVPTTTWRWLATTPAAGCPRPAPRRSPTSARSPHRDLHARSRRLPRLLRPRPEPASVSDGLMHSCRVVETTAQHHVRTSMVLWLTLRSKDRGQQTPKRMPAAPAHRHAHAHAHLLLQRHLVLSVRLNHHGLQQLPGFLRKPRRCAGEFLALPKCAPTHPTQCMQHAQPPHLLVAGG